MRVFLETSVFIRFFTQDDIKKYEEVSYLIEMIKQGKITPYVSNIVVTEIIFVLTRLYQFSKEKVLLVLTDLLNLRNLVLIEQTNTKEALNYFKKYNIKYTDCLIATQVPSGVKLMTYDADFSKIARLSVSTPKELIVCE